MDKNTLTPERAIELLEAVVAEVGEDYVYPDSERVRSDLHGGKSICQYVYDGQPSCIVGRVLHKLGISASVLSRYETSAAQNVVRSLFFNSHVAADILGVAQGAQDAGHDWGAALMTAKREYAHLREPSR